MADHDLSETELIYDWNSVGERGPFALERAVTLIDETLRDGIQSPSAIDPNIDDKFEIVSVANDLGIQFTEIGLPGAGKRALEDCIAIAKYIRDQKLSIKIACAARTHVKDIQSIVEVSQTAGVPIEVMTFIGSSPIRQYVENWDIDLLLQRTREAIRLAVNHGLPVTYVTEDTSRSRPEVLDLLFRNAVDHGAHRLCLCDTVGHSTPDGVRNLITWTRRLLDGTGNSQVGIDWHGHNDRGLGVANALFAIEHGADRIHGTALGIGERVGNAALDQILLNLKLLGVLPDNDLSKLPLWCKVVSKATQVNIPCQYPLAGSDAFRTATGVHAAAIIKAEKKGHAWLADRVYSGVPASEFGKQQEIEIGHYSGESNVVHWLEKHGIEPAPDLVREIAATAKRGNRVLTDEEVKQVIKERGALTDR